MHASRQQKLSFIHRLFSAWPEGRKVAIGPNIHFKQICRTWLQLAGNNHLPHPLPILQVCLDRSLLLIKTSWTAVLGCVVTGYFLIRYKFVLIQMSKSPWLECQIYDITSARGQRRNFHSDVIGQKRRNGCLILYHQCVVRVLGILRSMQPVLLEVTCQTDQLKGLTFALQTPCYVRQWMECWE